MPSALPSIRFISGIGRFGWTCTFSFGRSARFGYAQEPIDGGRRWLDYEFKTGPWQTIAIWVGWRRPNRRVLCRGVSSRAKWAVDLHRRQSGGIGAAHGGEIWLRAFRFSSGI